MPFTVGEGVGAGLAGAGGDGVPGRAVLVRLVLLAALVGVGLSPDNQRRDCPRRRSVGSESVAGAGWN
jgi:hypothetical protein